MVFNFLAYLIARPGPGKGWRFTDSGWIPSATPKVRTWREDRFSGITKLREAKKRKIHRIQTTAKPCRHVALKIATDCQS